MAVEIYALISEERLKSILETLYDFLEIQIQLIDKNGQILQAFGNPPYYCSMLKKRIFTASKCIEVQKKAGEYAKHLGEAYIFTCQANLNHIAFPLIHNEELLGTVIAGPFLIGQPDTTLIIDLIEKYQISPVMSVDLYDHLYDLKVLMPERISTLKKLMEHILSNLLPAERVFLLKEKDKMYQQAKINETIQIYKEQKKRFRHTALL